MRKHTIIEHEKFQQICQYKPAIQGKYAKNHMKMEMLSSCINAIGEKWYRIKKETRSALEYICFLSVERGFVYVGSEHVGSRYSIDSSTVRRYILELEKHGVIKRIWRSSTRHNGRGKAVIFFTIHPYYEKYWKNMFFSHVETQTNKQAENSENTRKIKENDKKIDSTVDVSNINTNINKRINAINIENIPLDHTYVSEKIPKKFVELTKIFFNVPNNWKIIEKMWGKVEMASWKNCMENEKDVKLEIAISSFKQLVRKMKIGKVRDIYGYFYGTVEKKFEKIFYESAFELLGAK